MLILYFFLGLADEELSVWGAGYLSLELGAPLGARQGVRGSPPLIARQDNVTLHFKTEAKDGIIFFSGTSHTFNFYNYFVGGGGGRKVI